jgi:cell division control protein 45
MDLLLRGEENDGGDMVASSRRESAETQADDEKEEEAEAEAAEAGKEDEEEEQAEEGAGEAAEEGDDAATTALTAAARRPRARRRARDWEAMGERVLQRRRVEQPSLPELRARNEQRRKLREYYSTSSYATSVACLAYEMAAQLDREHPDLLWCAIVGLTDQLVHERIERSAYASQASTFVQRVSSLESARRARPSSIRAAAAAMAAAAAAAGAADADQLVQVARNGEMSVQTDVRFMLFRHWTLYDSMYFSHYVATKFQIWTQPGKQRLEYLLAKMGIPLAESRQQYRFMTAAHKSALGAQLKLYAPKFHLQDVFFGSFTRQLGGMLVSAADVVYALTALLESPQTRGASPSSARQPGDGPAAAARAVATPTAAAAATANAEGGVEAEAEAEAGPEAHEWDDRFWAAEEALASGNATLLRAGIQEAIRLQVAIVRQAESILQNKALVSAGPFRYAIVEDPVDDAAFVQPLTLSRLALFIVDAMREKKKKKPKPMVLAVQSRASSTYTVIGLAEKAFDGHVGRNSFGIAFREAAEHTRARIRHDGFDASIIEVLRDDVRHFVEYLHSGLCESLRI